MSDTQWLRFEVFKQDTPEQPHSNVGTVHAPDRELALLNARDVFVRRPSCASLWVAPADQILACTAEELAANPPWQEEESALDAPRQTYYVFQKRSQRRTMTFVTYVGQVEAQTPAQALKEAVETFAAPDVFVWWICPAAAITQSEPAVAESWFAPAKEKSYRQQSQYGAVGRVRRKLQQREQVQQEGEAQP